MIDEKYPGQLGVIVLMGIFAILAGPIVFCWWLLVGMWRWVAFRATPEGGE